LLYQERSRAYTRTFSRTFSRTFWPYYKWNKVISLCPIKYATRLQLHNTTRFASKLHGTKRMFLRTFWWSYNKIRITSHMAPYHSWPTITRVFSPNSRNSKNVLKKVLQLTNVSFFSTLAHQATKHKHMGCFQKGKHNCFCLWSFKT